MRRPMMRRTEFSKRVCVVTTPLGGIPEIGRKIKRLPKRIIGGAVFLTYRRPP